MKTMLAAALIALPVAASAAGLDRNTPTYNAAFGYYLAEQCGKATDPATVELLKVLMRGEYGADAGSVLLVIRMDADKALKDLTPDQRREFCDRVKKF